MSGIDIYSHPIHLGAGATAVSEPEFIGGIAWYEAYVERHLEDRLDGRLVSIHTFSESWDTWEMHPNGSEVVLCISGEISLIQESLSGDAMVTHLASGRYLINQPGVWHTADLQDTATVLFITAGWGTQHRQR